MATRSLVFPRIIPRPTEGAGLIGWLTTVDHKRIGTMYGFVAFFWFLIGGIEALLIREQLRSAERGFIDPETYNQLFTMHGTTMVFLVVMPLSAAFFNWIVPLQLGARDVAFPRLNAFSLWTFVFGSILLNVSWLTGDAPNGGWFGYAPNSGPLYNPGLGMTYWTVGLIALGTASLAAALNFLVTIINMRAPGMNFFRMPVFIWMTLITSVLMILAMPVLTVALIQLQTDRLYGTNFFNPLAGGDPVIWQHIFWLFGHPEVYILILPAMGIVSEIIPTFSRKPLFGYQFVVFAGLVIAFLGWFVWSHHMFTVGLGPAANSAFALATMAIGIPTGVKIFNWLGTLWGGSIKLTTALLFAVSFIAMFTIGGISGVMHAVAPSDAQQQDTYFVVAHFHYVLFGGAIMAIFGGIYYWWPKFTGWMLNERWGIATWALMLVGFNLQFAPQHWLGLDGMPRRIYTYAAETGWEASNFAASMGGFLIGVSIIVFLIGVWRSSRVKVPAGDDPWDGRTLEWSISSPPPEYNFEQIPEVKELDDFWHQKYPEASESPGNDDEGEDEGKTSAQSERIQKPPSGGSVNEDVVHSFEGHDDAHGGSGGGIHLPQKSYYPILISAGLAILGGGFLTHYAVIAVGAIVVLWAMMGWSMEPVNDPEPEH